jgi:hypothetical protein
MEVPTRYHDIARWKDAATEQSTSGNIERGRVDNTYIGYEKCWALTHGVLQSSTNAPVLCRRLRQKQLLVNLERTCLLLQDESTTLLPNVSIYKSR